ncbi:amidase family protein [Streptomyces sp. KMM 9044]|uniref:amidase family protein n=1 Tax=Streptomyces sp. KMM 9044 TaxID=2744474 RepID=UPI0021514739|nr:amidase family protein [Streptomyces sp. KMM 9044]WAX81237.1 amidase family protein [Streptomyces sp. KMM 9044]
MALPEDLRRLDEHAQLYLLCGGHLTRNGLLYGAVESNEDVDGRLGAIVAAAFDRALDEADRPDSDPAERGPRHEVPVLVTNLTAALQETTMGSRFPSGFVLDQGSESRDRFRAAELQLRGRTRTAESDILPAIEPELQGPTVELWDPRLGAGGSEGGAAAAVAAGLGPVAHAYGADGLLPVPASTCALFGLTPPAPAPRWVMPWATWREAAGRPGRPHPTALRRLHLRMRPDVLRPLSRHDHRAGLQETQGLLGGPRSHHRDRVPGRPRRHRAGNGVAHAGRRLGDADAVPPVHGHVPAARPGRTSRCIGSTLSAPCSATSAPSASTSTGQNARRGARTTASPPGPGSSNRGSRPRRSVGGPRGKPSSSPWGSCSPVPRPRRRRSAVRAVARVLLRHAESDRTPAQVPDADGGSASF